MEHVSIRLTEAQQAFVDAQLADGKYPDAETCIAAAVQAATKAWAQDRLEAELEEGFNSEELEWTPELVDEIRRDAGLTA